MEQLDLFSFKKTQDLPIESIQDNLPKVKKTTSKKVRDILSANFSFDFLKYHCYNIEKKYEKISKIKFKIWKNKFLIYIDYDFWKETINHINYSETNKEDRENSFEKITINNIKILSIQKKVKVKYSESTNSVNYYKYAWIDYFSLKSFIEELIKNYHNKNNPKLSLGI